MPNTKYFQVILIANKCKAVSESHNKLLDIVSDLLLRHTLVNILNITHSQSFHTDEVQQIFSKLDTRPAFCPASPSSISPKLIIFAANSDR